MKRVPIMLFLLSFLVATTARGFDFKKTIGGKTLFFTVLPGDTTAVVVAPGGSADGWDGTPKPAGRIAIPSAVQYDGNRYSVVAVDENAFLECDKITSVTIPPTVTALGNNAFGQCSSLRSIVLECDSLGAAYNTFVGCTAVDTIILSHSVRKLPPFIFSDFTAVGNIIMRCECAETMKNLFFGCQADAVLWVGNNMSKIPDFICYNFVGLKRVEYDGNASQLVEVGECAFVGCTGIEYLALPASVSKLGQGAFAHCTPRVLSFRSALSPNAPASAFLGIDRMVEVIIPCGSIDSYANSAIGRHFGNLQYDGRCSDSTDRLKIVYVHDTVYIRDTIYMSDSLGTIKSIYGNKKNVVTNVEIQKSTHKSQKKNARQDETRQETVDPYDELDEPDMQVDDDEEDSDEPFVFVEGKTLRIARATKMRGVGVRLFDEKGRLIVDDRIPDDQPTDNYYIRLPRRQRYFLRFDMGAPMVVDVENQEVK